MAPGDRRCVARAGRGQATSLQPHHLSPRAGHQGGPRRAARRVRDTHPDRAGPGGGRRRRAPHRGPPRRGPRRGRGVPAAHPVDGAPRQQARPERPEPRASGNRGRALRLAGLEGEDGRGADERLLPPRPHRVAGALARARSHGPGPGAGPHRRGRRQHRAPARRGRLHRHRARVAAAAHVAPGVPGRDRRRVRGGPRDPHLHRAARRPLHVRAVLPGKGRVRGVPALPETERGPLPPAVGDARERAARTHVPRVPQDLLPGHPRLLPQVHGRRAHPRDHPQPVGPDRSGLVHAVAETVLGGAGGARRARAHRPRAALPRRRQVDQQEPRRGERAHGRGAPAPACGSPRRRPAPSSS